MSWIYLLAKLIKLSNGLAKISTHILHHNLIGMERSSFQMLFGAIDGCHIRISANENEKQAYRNYKRYHSIHLQAVCSYDCKFIDIFVGYVDKEIIFW